MNDRLDRDGRIKYRAELSGSNVRSIAGVAFDGERGLVFAVAHSSSHVSAFSLDSESFARVSCNVEAMAVCQPTAIAVDWLHRVVVTEGDSSEHRVAVLSSSSLVYDARSRVWAIAARAAAQSSLCNSPQGVAVDANNHRIVVADTDHHRVVAFSAVDGSFVFASGTEGTAAGEFNFPHGVAIDHARDRIIVADTHNHRMQVLSLIDGSFLFEFSKRRDARSHRMHTPVGVCIDNRGRVIVASCATMELQAFTPEGYHVSSFDCGGNCDSPPWAVAFDEQRGLIAFSAGNRIYVIGANQWLDSTFVWSLDRHRYAPSEIKQVVLTMTLIRSLVCESPLSLLPNELLFEIFARY